MRPLLGHKYVNPGLFISFIFCHHNMENFPFCDVLKSFALLTDASSCSKGVS